MYLLHCNGIVASTVVISILTYDFFFLNIQESKSN